MMNQPVFRFAPSPNGHLHLGHAYSALLNQKIARESGGKLLLRIEDIDTTRCTPELESQMLQDLEWIGFEWDETPRRQSQHFGEYRDYLEKLDKMDLIYPATMSRSEIKKFITSYEDQDKSWPRDPDGSPIYPGKERDFDTQSREEILQSAQPYALRFNTQKALKTYSERLSWQETNGLKTEQVFAHPNNWGDVILARKDTPTSYHLCCVIDDAIQDITNVVRGKDLYEATSIHVLLQKILVLPAPLYHHHKLIVDDKNQKLSKSKKHKSLKELRASGFTANDVLELLNLSDQKAL